MLAQLTHRCIQLFFPQRVSGMTFSFAILRATVDAPMRLAAFFLRPLIFHKPAIVSEPLDKDAREGARAGHQPFSSLVERWEGVASGRALCLAVRHAQKVARALYYRTQLRC